MGSDGALYYLDRGENGLVKKIVYTASQAPSISSHPQNQTASVGSSVTFAVAANGTAPLAYQWQRDGVDIPGATSLSYTVESVSTGDDGANFRAVVRNAHGSVTSNSAKLIVTNNHAPSVSILAPSGITYNAGDVIEFEGDATGRVTNLGRWPA